MIGIVVINFILLGFLSGVSLAAPYDIRNINDAVFSNPLGTKHCKVSGVFYKHSQKILFTDHCKACVCIDGQIFCYWQCDKTAPETLGEDIENELQFTPTTNIISSTFEMETSSKIPIASSYSIKPLKKLQTTTTTPNDTITEASCLVMGVRYKPGNALPKDAGSCVECLCGQNSKVECTPKGCIEFNTFGVYETSPEPEFYGNNNGQQNNENFNLDMFAVNVV